ncbi:MAG: hypothetical protein IJ744_09410 [Lachnospiraceae bacterium]|nr:hypothetical protein [Lachnospiraceae bacterium]
MSEQIVLIGTGYLAEYLIPCYEKCLGDVLKGHMIGIKGSLPRLEERQKVFPFPLRVLGTEHVLRERKPELILMAAKPNQVPGIVEETLVPYYEEVRARGEKLPVLYSFAPSPSVGWLTDTLGEDACICNMLPSMLREIAGVDTADAGISYLSFDPRAPWSEEERAAACAFLRPTGQILEIAGEQAAAFLGIHEGTHVVYEFTMICCDVLRERGEELSYAAAAGAMRKALREAIHRDYLTPIPIAEGMREEHYPFWKNLIYSYLGGILEYAAEVGIDPEKAILKVAASMEMNLMFVQNATPEKMRQAVASHATKGGVLEKENTSFREFGYEKLEEGWRKYLDGQFNDWEEAVFDDEMADVAYEIAGIVSRHTAGLSGVTWK